MPGDLTFRAVIEAIENAPLARSQVNWIVRTRILEVISGEFSGATFAFRVHSPARSGYEVGATRTIVARWIGDGYVVD